METVTGRRYLRALSHPEWGGAGEWGTTVYANEVEVEHLPFGQKAVWHPDLNIVTILRGLCPAEREAALDELQARWRRTVVRHAPVAVAERRQLSASTPGSR